MEEPVVEPAAGEARVRVAAIGLNRAEAAFREGSYLVSASPPSGIGFEASGRVVAVGEGVVDLAVGDYVAVVPSLDPTRYGTYAEEPVLPAACLIRLPEGIGPVSAASALMQYLTAYGGLVELAKVAKGDFVVVTAAGSSVGIAAIQIARERGAIPIAVTRSSRKRRALIAAGAETVVLSMPTIAADLVTATGGRGADIVFDAVVGEGLTDLADGCAPYARIVVYGALGGLSAPLPFLQLIAKGLTIRGWYLHEMFGDRQRLDHALGYVIDRLHSGALTPVVDREFTLSDVVAAHHYLESNVQVGKVVLMP
ncbi:zinc-dependent alcohol dehydrogenase family protein [Streptomyces sp. NPDC093085]|uniref:zinc-dependent alcohol dehydrogenase family protein n=1 Tax=Streptomyces sp. NPDC093085 TaxID=3155068 RepID=UPI00343D35F1